MLDGDATASTPPRGGSADIEIRRVDRSHWEELNNAENGKHWDAETVGYCDIEKKDPDNPDAITRVDFVLNKGFAPFEDLILAKKLSEEQTPKSLRKRRCFPSVGDFLPKQ